MVLRKDGEQPTCLSDVSCLRESIHVGESRTVTDTVNARYGIPLPVRTKNEKRGRMVHLGYVETSPSITFTRLPITLLHSLLGT